MSIEAPAGWILVAALAFACGPRPEQHLPREQLLDQVWGLEYYGEARTLDVHISGLRKKLGVCGNAIETVIGIGYRFRGCAELSHEAAAASH